MPSCYEYNLFEIDRTCSKAKDKLPTGKVKIEVVSTQAVPKPGGPLGFDLGDRSSWYCVLDKAGEVISEQKAGHDSESNAGSFCDHACSRIALEIGMHSPWVSRLFTSP